jgi:hypothetical protein
MDTFLSVVGYVLPSLVTFAIGYLIGRDVGAGQRPRHQTTPPAEPVRLVDERDQPDDGPRTWQPKR